MYMRNRKHDTYNMGGFPENYSGQYSPESLEKSAVNPEENTPPQEQKEAHEPANLPEKVTKEPQAVQEQKVKKGGLLSGLFNKESGIFGSIELEDLILLAVIFFLIKDGFEEDIIIILAIILLSG
jgi:hypothetical protein